MDFELRKRTDRSLVESDVNFVRSVILPYDYTGSAIVRRGKETIEATPRYKASEIHERLGRERSRVRV